MARVLLLGGLDPCGGAGITADATVVSLHGQQPLPIAVVLTAQNRRGFRDRYPVPEVQWRAAFDAALAEGPVHAIKTGLLGGEREIELVARMLAPLAPTVPLIVDPVLSATAGGYSATAEIVAAYRQHLLPLAALATPNDPELQVLAGGDASALSARGCRAVLHKGGHGEGAEAVDVLHGPGTRCEWRRRRLDIGPVHGTGCALASSIAARLAAGHDLVAACADAGDWLAALLAALDAASADGLPRSLPFAVVPPVMRTSRQ